MGNALGVRFWEDKWLGDSPLAIQYPSLYSILRNKNVSVAHVLSNNPLHIEFPRSLTGDKWTSYCIKVLEA